jgi:signal transduction histidine kinase
VKKDIPGPASTTVSGARVIVASNKPEELNQVDANDAFLFALAEADTSHSVTIQETAGSERLFRTVRAITDDGGSVIGIALTSQTLSEADRAIERDIRNSFFLLVGVLVVIMLLFLRHSKIIDYMALYKKLQEVDQLKDDFISMASHELRTPLTVIRGYSEYIREAPGLTPETKEYAQKIDVSVQGLDSLVADILDVSRIDQGRMSFTFEKFNPEEVVREIADQLAVTAKEKGLTLSCAIETGSDAFITADKSRLKQVLVNIVGNAVKYTVKGEVKIRLYAEKNRVVIRVSDTGLGMSEEERAHLFEKFFRIKTKETENIRGTGLGLWITKQMVEEMKGSISVESIKGVGSHFIVSFPIVG